MKILKTKIRTLYLIVLALYLCSSGSSFGAIPKIDSLRYVLNQEAPNWAPEELAELYLEIGKTYLEINNYKQAVAELERGWKTAEGLGQVKLTHQFLLQLGHAYQGQLNYDASFEAYHLFLKEGGRRLPKKEGAAAHTGISNLYLANGKYDEAYKSATDALLLLEQVRDTSGMSSAHFNIGNIHFKQERFDLALKSYLTALEIGMSINNDKNIYESNAAIASVYKKLDKKDKALHYNRKALALAELHGDQEGIAKGKKNNAQLYMELGLYEKAFAEFEEALKLEQAFNDEIAQVTSLHGMGEAELKMVEPERSLFYLDEALCLATRLDLPRERSNIYASLAAANAQLGNEKDGYYFLNNYVAIRNELVNEASLREMGQVKNQYEISSRENEIALLKAEKKILAKEQKIKGLYWFLLLLFVVCFSGILFVLFSKWKMQSRLFNLLEQKSQKIKEQNNKLAQSNLDLQQFASVASHDLREPLRMINSYTKLLNKRYSDAFDASGREFMHFITDAATRMDRMLTDLLDYSKAQNKGEREQWVSAAELVDLALDNLKFKIEAKDVRINWEKSHLPQIFCNKTAMIQLFQNLIGNAVKFTHKTNPEVIINCQKRGGKYVFSVKDNGIGIKKENQAKIFEMFQRLHSQQEFEGTGIGLATCKKIVDRHNGDIWVESENGNGSTFFFTIPQDVQSN